MVEGAEPFLLLAVWMKGVGPDRYVRGLNRAIDACRALIARHPTVVLGDFNSNTIWDREHPGHLSHSALVGRLDALGLESAYHRARGEPHGKEREATFYFYRRRTAPYHLDYCFLPRRWTPRLRRVTVGGWKEWRSLSDHVPLVCDLAPLPPARPPS
jgi:endonuclease/exonuclease/phosphatase family metal-dependent hydrolase